MKFISVNRMQIKNYLNDTPILPHLKLFFRMNILAKSSLFENKTNSKM